MIARQYFSISTLIAAAAALVLAFGIATGAQAARQITPSAVVDGPVVTLGNLFDHADGAAWADTAVANAPAPGETRLIHTIDVVAAARRAGLAWDASAAPRTITVTRSGQPVPLETLERILAAALPADVGGKNWQLQLNNQRMSLYLPTDCKPGDISVRRMYFDDRSGSFNATLVIPGDNGSHREATVTGRLIEMASVPVLGSPVSRGDLITRHDIHWIRIPARKVTRNVVASSQDIVGMTARRPLRADALIRPGDIEPPVLVKKGAMVTMVVATKAMTLTATGRALQKGSKGDLIRLVNISTHTTVEGVVVSTNRVAVHTNSRVAALR